MENLLDPKELYCLIGDHSIPEIGKIKSLINIMVYDGVKEAPRVIFDLGSRDLYESIWFSVNIEGSEVHSFECNPDMIPLCEKRSRYFPAIKFNPVAVSDKNGEIEFHKVNQEKTRSQDNIPYYIQKDGNPGASSIFISKDKTYYQDKVKVETVALKSYMESNSIEKIDILWMDIQGAEKMALLGLEERINDVAWIHIEMPTEKNTEYEGAPTYSDIHNFLLDNGFLLMGKGVMDSVYANARFRKNNTIV